MTPTEQDIRARNINVLLVDQHEMRILLNERKALLSIIDSLRAEKEKAQGLLLLQWHEELEESYLEKYLIDNEIISLKASATL